MAIMGCPWVYLMKLFSEKIQMTAERTGEMEINHVLVVEDDKEIREGVQIYLQSQGYQVFQAADGVEGLEVLEKKRSIWRS